MSNYLFKTFDKITSNRKSTRCFSDKPVPDDYIKKIIKIAETSPYASGKKNWGIEIVKDKNIIKKASEIVQKKVMYLESKIRVDFRDEFHKYSKSFVSFETAPALIVTNFRIAPSLALMISDKKINISNWERDNYVKSISCVATFIILAAESLGLGACYITGALIAEDDLIKLFEIKHGRNIGALIPIGFKK